MTDLRHPTNGEWELFDPLIYPAPRGVSLLLVQEGETLIVGQWYDGALAWGLKPKIPATVKARLTQKLQQHREKNDANYRERQAGQMDAPAPVVDGGALDLPLRVWDGQASLDLQPPPEKD